MNNNKDKIVIANMSGFYGDRFSTALEMVEGGPVDFLTGDYLAELTMAILYKSKSQRLELGYAVTFLKQMEDITLSESGMMPVSANAYLGCWGIVEALNKGADIVVTGRVADTSVVMGPAAHHFGWSKDDWDALARAATVGHIIECSGQATGGNYAFFQEVPSFKNVGFPLAEVFADGSSVIAKHPNTGGLVSVGTVTAQLYGRFSKYDDISPGRIRY